METVEDDLLGNTFPYPQYYDGRSWNTITHNTRKSIPKYLKSELPNMKYLKVKAKFQEMNKFMPPEITYFEKMIAASSTARRRSAKTSRERTSSRRRDEQQVENLRE
jgi:hypothetical protein